MYKLYWDKQYVNKFKLPLCDNVQNVKLKGYA